MWIPKAVEVPLLLRWSQLRRAKNIIRSQGSFKLCRILRTWRRRTKNTIRSRGSLKLWRIFRFPSWRRTKNIIKPRGSFRRRARYEGNGTLSSSRIFSIQYCDDCIHSFLLCDASSLQQRTHFRKLQNIYNPQAIQFKKTTKTPMSLALPPLDNTNSELHRRRIQDATKKQKITPEKRKKKLNKYMHSLAI